MLQLRRSRDGTPETHVDVYRHRLAYNGGARTAETAVHVAFISCSFQWSHGSHDPWISANCTCVNVRQSLGIIAFHITSRMIPIPEDIFREPFANLANLAKRFHRLRQIACPSTELSLHADRDPDVLELLVTSWSQDLVLITPVLFAPIVDRTN